MASHCALSRNRSAGSLPDPLQQPLYLPFEQAKEKIKRELNSENLEIENLERIIKILKCTDSKNRINLLFLTKDPIRLSMIEIIQEMTLFHLILYKLLKEKAPLAKKKLHNKLIEIFELIPKEDRTGYLAAQSCSGRNIMHLAAATWNEDFNLLKELLEMLPEGDRVYCLETQEEFQNFAPLHLAAYRVAKAISQLNLPLSAIKQLDAIAICKKQLEPIIGLLSNAEKEKVEKIKDLFGRNYLKIIEEIISPPDKYYRIDDVWSGYIPGI